MDKQELIRQVKAVIAGLRFIQSQSAAYRTVSPESVIGITDRAVTEQILAAERLLRLLPGLPDGKLDPANASVNKKLEALASMQRFYQKTLKIVDALPSTAEAALFAKRDQYFQLIAEVPPFPKNLFFLEDSEYKASLDALEESIKEYNEKTHRIHKQMLQILGSGSPDHSQYSDAIRKLEESLDVIETSSARVLARSAVLDQVQGNYEAMIDAKERLKEAVLPSLSSDQWVVIERYHPGIKPNFDTLKRNVDHALAESHSQSSFFKSSFMKKLTLESADREIQATLLTVKALTTQTTDLLTTIMMSLDKKLSDLNGAFEHHYAQMVHELSKAKLPTSDIDKIKHEFDKPHSPQASGDTPISYLVSQVSRSMRLLERLNECIQSENRNIIVGLESKALVYQQQISTAGANYKKDVSFNTFQWRDEEAAVLSRIRKRRTWPLHNTAESVDSLIEEQIKLEQDIARFDQIFLAHQQARDTIRGIGSQARQGSDHYWAEFFGQLNASASVCNELELILRYSPALKTTEAFLARMVKHLYLVTDEGILAIKKALLTHAVSDDLTTEALAYLDYLISKGLVHDKPCMFETPVIRAANLLHTLGLDDLVDEDMLKNPSYCKALLLLNALGFHVKDYALSLSLHPDLCEVLAHQKHPKKGPLKDTLFSKWIASLLLMTPDVSKALSTIHKESQYLVKNTLIAYLMANPQYAPVFAKPENIPFLDGLLEHASGVNKLFDEYIGYYLDVDTSLQQQAINFFEQHFKSYETVYCSLETPPKDMKVMSVFMDTFNKEMDIMMKEKWRLDTEDKKALAAFRLGMVPILLAKGPLEKKQSQLKSLAENHFEHRKRDMFFDILGCLLVIGLFVAAYRAGQNQSWFFFSSRKSHSHQTLADNLQKAFNTTSSTSAISDETPPEQTGSSFGN